MLDTLAALVIRRRRTVLITTLVLALLGGVLGVGVFARLSDGGFISEDSESFRATAALQEEFEVQPGNFVLLVDGKGSTVDDEAVAVTGRDIASGLAAEPQVQDVVSYFTSPEASALVSRDRTKALITARVTGEEPDARATELAAEYSADGPVAVTAGGAATVEDQIGSQVEEDLARAETIAFPIVFVLLVFVFGSVVAALLPLLVGVLAILGSLLALRIVTEFTDVSVFSINLVTMLGLGLGIDYSLFIVSRYREELRRGLETHAAIVRSVRTAGKTIVFSAVAIAAAMSTMLVFPLYFLRSFAYAGIAEVGLAAVVSLVVLPALLAALGPRIDKWRVLRRPAPEDGSGFWGRVARLVMARPMLVIAVTTVFLLALAAPFLNVRWGPVDDRVLPADTAVRVVSDSLRNDFDQNSNATLSVIARDIGDTSSRSNDIAAFGARLSQLDDVTRVESATAAYVDGSTTTPSRDRSALLTPDSVAYEVVLAVDPASTAAQNVVKAIRDQPAPFDVAVAGTAAEQVDSNEPILDGLIPALLVLVVSSFVILFLMTGSVVLPLKAMVTAALSLTASLGAIVWIFQYGNLSDFLGFTPTGAIDHTNLIVMFCIAFGLSMDYEVFLLSRIKEEHDRTGDTTTAIAHGMERTGRLVTAAALLISVVFLAFATAGVSFIKLIGLGLAIAVLVDATVIRGALVPAFMKVMGEANWWAPEPLRRFHDRYGLSER